MMYLSHLPAHFVAKRLHYSMTVLKISAIILLVTDSLLTWMKFQTDAGSNINLNLKPNIWFFN